MLKDRTIINQKMKDDLKKLRSDKNLINDIAEKVKVEYNVPITDSIDFFTLYKSAEAYTDFELFAMLSVYDSRFTKGVFTPLEIKMYSTMKKEEDNVKFPLVFDMIEIGNDQYIGRISCQDIIKYGKANLITYNIEQQRILKKKIKGENTFWQIDIDSKQVDAIATSYMENEFIPNTITFNMPEDTDFEYTDGKLIINSMSTFYITDGYHRYLGLKRATFLKGEIDKNMELRITWFPDKKAKQFIWQEDQKHQMTRVEATSLKQNTNGTQIVELLNNDCGLFSNEIKVGGLISSTKLIVIINSIFTVNNRKDMIDIKNKLKESILTISSKYNELYDSVWNDEMILAAVLYAYDNTIDIDKMIMNFNNNKDKIHRHITQEATINAYKQYMY